VNLRREFSREVNWWLTGGWSSGSCGAGKNCNFWITWGTAGVSGAEAPAFRRIVVAADRGGLDPFVWLWVISVGVLEAAVQPVTWLERLGGNTPADLVVFECGSHEVCWAAAEPPNRVPRVGIRSAIPCCQGPLL